MSSEKKQSVVEFFLKLSIPYLRYGDNSGINIKYFLNLFKLCIYCKKFLGELIENSLLKWNWNMTLAER